MNYPCKPDIFAATYEPAEDIANKADDGGAWWCNTHNLKGETQT